LACARVQVLVVDEHPAGARAALREALAAAEDVVPGAARGDSQDPSGGGAAARETEELQVAVATAPALAALGRFDEALELAERAASFSDRAAQPVYGLRVTDTQAVLAEVLMLQMRDREARAAATRALVASIGDDEELAARGAEWVLARLSVYCDLEGALRWADDVRSGAAVFGPELLRHEATALLVHLHALRGDIVRAEALLAELEPHADEHRVGWGVARLLVQAARGDVSGAWPGLGRWADRMREQGHLGYAGGMLVMMLQFGPAADIAPRARALADAAPGPYFERLAAHAAAAADGDAPALLRIAHEWEEDGALLLAASAYGEAARAQQRGGAERAAARSQARAEELARRMGGLSTPVVRFADELTPLTRREREIANLAASGLSSKDIAARLFLSARTVDNHLQSVYGKLGITGRHELALG
ncbi:MAG: helix-turn-helix transcriptional regulator, partial [Microbacteriaceae bacterium]|nr:helix-turn-helix transcriptional regulator [Microbacteriaceae bacterium]